MLQVFLYLTHILNLMVLNIHNFVIVYQLCTRGKNIMEKKKMC